MAKMLKILGKRGRITIPFEIRQSKGGSADGNTIVFDFGGLTDQTEIAAVSEANNYGVVLGICGGLIAVVAVLFFIIRKRK